MNDTWEDEFDIHFNEDTLVSAHNKWTPDLIKEFIHSLLKQQREICAEAYIKQRDYHVARTITSDCILNAPEPGEIG